MHKRIHKKCPEDVSDECKRNVSRTKKPRNIVIIRKRKPNHSCCLYIYVCVSLDHLVQRNNNISINVDKLEKMISFLSYFERKYRKLISVIGDFCLEPCVLKACYFFDQLHVQFTICWNIRAKNATISNQSLSNWHDRHSCGIISDISAKKSS